MKIRRERYFSIHSIDKPGEGASITAQLMNNRVDCSGIWGFGTTGHAAEIMVVPRSAERFKELARDTGWKFNEGICFHLEGQDKTGVLVNVLENLAKDGINVKAVDAIAVEGKFGCYLWVSDADLEHVAQLLGLSTPKP